MSGDTAYLMSYHMNGSTWLDSDGLHLAYSYDAKRWTPLRNGPASCGTFGSDLARLGFGQGLFVRPEVGHCRFLEYVNRAWEAESRRGEPSTSWTDTLTRAQQCRATGKMLRDPFVMYHAGDQRYHALWTDGWASNTIGHASSADLVHWSPQRALHVTKGLAHAINAWAPEAYYDPTSKRTIIFWATSSGAVWKRPSEIQTHKQTMYYVLADANWTRFTEPRVLLENHKPGGVIDATMTQDGQGRFHVVYKNVAGQSAPAL